MMEQIFNLFYFSTSDVITEVGVVGHLIEGSDNDKIAFLQANVESDLLAAKKFPLPELFKLRKDGITRNAIDHVSYRNLCLEHKGLLIFENIFNHYNAKGNPLVIVTPVREGIIYYEGVDELKPIDYIAPSHMHIEQPEDWLKKYVTSAGFNLVGLIDDDYFTAIKILFREQQFVSSMKLLLICIDTISFLEFDDTPKNFITWLDRFADLTTLGITSEQLWEFRNSLLHMSNLDSRKVRNNQVNRIQFYVAPENVPYPKKSDEGTNFNFRSFLKVIDSAINKWAQSFNTDRSKLETFVNRYDRVVADSRMTKTYYDNRL